MIHVFSLLAEYFTVRRYKPVTYATTTTLAQASTGNATNKPVKSVCTKFQVTNSDLFVVGASIPIRLDPGFDFLFFFSDSHKTYKNVLC